MRVLQSLPNDSLPRNLESKESTRPIQIGRTESVVSKVFSALSLLVSSSNHESLQKDLRQLSYLAIDIWNDAQTDQLKIMVSPSLDPMHREEWRSQEFDPASSNNDGLKLDAASKTRPRIFTLFPWVKAREVADTVNNETELPGSWPQDSEPLPSTIETSIHFGEGLPESSPLVVRGKEEQEEIDAFISEMYEKAKKDVRSRRIPGQSRRESMGSSISGPPSPSERWKREGTMKIQHSES